MILIGSANCGKSTIAGHLLLKCGVISEQEVQRYKKAGIEMGKTGAEFAWVLNRLVREREMGVSIEAHSWGLDTEQYEVDVIDVPGHSNFIKSIHLFVSK
jgi:translation elongation factor EF-1alpha